MSTDKENLTSQKVYRKVNEYQERIKLESLNNKVEEAMNWSKELSPFYFSEEWIFRMLNIEKKDIRKYKISKIIKYPQI